MKTIDEVLAVALAGKFAGKTAAGTGATDARGSGTKATRTKRVAAGTDYAA